MKATVAKVTKHNIPEIFLPKLPRLLMLLKVVYECASESYLSEEKRITSSTPPRTPTSGGVRCLPKVFQELVEDSGLEVANLDSTSNVPSPSKCYKCDKLSD